MSRRRRRRRYSFVSTKIRSLDSLSYRSIHLFSSSSSSFSSLFLFVQDDDWPIIAAFLAQILPSFYRFLFFCVLPSFFFVEHAETL